MDNHTHIVSYTWPYHMARVYCPSNQIPLLTDQSLLCGTVHAMERSNKYNTGGQSTLQDR